MESIKPAIFCIINKYGELLLKNRRNGLLDFWSESEIEEYELLNNYSIVRFDSVGEAVWFCQEIRIWCDFQIGICYL